MPQSTTKNIGKIQKVAGPLVVAVGSPEAKMYEVAKVGEKKLLGEVIRIEKDQVFIQVYEETSGVGPGEPVELTGDSLAVELGPGLLSSIYDGIQRPLPELQKKSGAFIEKGIEAQALSREKRWHFKPKRSTGDRVQRGDVLGEVLETETLVHKIMVPPFFKDGEILEIVPEGDYSIDQKIGVIKTPEGMREITMFHKWPIRQPRPIKEKLLPQRALITGQRVIDTFFPIAKGGAGCVPGPFGSGKTVIQHQLAKWSDANVIVFVGCGERGNEMAELLKEFPKLEDPNTGKPLIQRTILIANTSNMPVAAREASIYTAITIAEYYRDMGYSVVVLADSTSRWAEALREISGRLEEMPGDEGYPAYLGSRTASFYERAGLVRGYGSDQREGSVTVIGAVSPPGGDLSEPVTQNTLRVTKVFWALDSSLAYKRHFPAINWLDSYSLYLDNLRDFFEKEGGEGFNEIRQRAMEVLQKENNLQEIVRLVGVEALSEEDQFTLEIARMIREDFLHQNAYDRVDTYTPLKKQYWILKKIMDLEKRGREEIKKGQKLNKVLTTQIKEEISKLKFSNRENH